MRVLGRAVMVAVVALAWSGCTAASGEGDGADRHPIGKADSSGSCEATMCDGMAPGGNCYCDSACVRYGDCCSDRDAICGGGPAPSGMVPELGGASRSFEVVADASDGLDTPRDSAFNPERPNELWTVNQATDSVVLFVNPGKSTQRVDVRKDAFANHFMEEVSSIAFGQPGTFATCQESRNTYDNLAPPNDFMGPTLWPSDSSIFAAVNQDPRGDMLGSHIDMLHESPLCMGIEHVENNAYFVFDGLHGHVVYYDFKRDHGPGYDDHSDGVVRRYVEASVTRVPGVPGHLALDRDSGWLYVADPGGRRVIRLDVRTGRVVPLSPSGLSEPLAEYSRVVDFDVEVFASGLQVPSGLVVDDGRVFVSDIATGEIIAYDTDGDELARAETPARGIMGMTLGPDGKLWYVDGVENQLVRLDP